MPKKPKPDPRRAERERVARYVERYADRQKKFVWYHPHLALKALADRIRKGRWR